MLLTIISTVGSVASIVAVILVFTHKDTVFSIKALLVIITILTVTTSAVSYKNSIYSSSEYAYEKKLEDVRNRKIEASKEAKQLLLALPDFTSQYNQGDSQGIVLSGIAFLEKYRDIYPDSYELIKNEVLNDLTEAKGKRDSSGSGQILADAAKAILQVLRGIAGPNEN